MPIAKNNSNSHNAGRTCSLGQYQVLRTGPVSMVSLDSGFIGH
jgi:hypothetical protein